MVVPVFVSAAGRALETMEFRPICEGLIQTEKEVHIIFIYLHVTFVAVNIDIIPCYDITSPRLRYVVDMLLRASYALTTGSKVAMFATLVHLNYFRLSGAHVALFLLLGV